jgi:hypothetical protein
MPTTTRADRALENVQNLYAMQFQLLGLLESDLRDPEVRKEVRTQMKQFEELLARADWRYMGGQDVWETLKSLPEEMARKLKESAVATAKRTNVKKAGKKKAGRRK